jgi:hypothetical protein
MRYNEGSRLRLDAERVSNGVAANQSQESLGEQLKDLHALANRFGLYGAADWLDNLITYQERFQRDYGQLTWREEITSYVNDMLDSTFPDEAGRLS